MHTTMYVRCHAWTRLRQQITCQQCHADEKGCQELGQEQGLRGLRADVLGTLVRGVRKVAGIVACARISELAAPFVVGVRRSDHHGKEEGGAHQRPEELCKEV